MKFMKLGSRPDTFCTTEAVRSVSSEVSSDIIVQVKDTRYMLHKFPLLSKCLLLQRLCSESPESSHIKIVQLPDFPGGIDTFELCSKFCYGITITISAYNVVAARCAAEYLQMTEDVETGNLIDKLEAFLNSCILRGWKDSVVTLQSTKSYPVWSEDLGITSRSINAITAKVLTHPSKVSLSHSHSRRGRDDMSSCNGGESKGWWAEDIAELSLDLYWRTMIAIKSTGKVPSNLIGDALKVYAAKWLPRTSRETQDSITSKHRLLLESMVSLLPIEKGAVSCSFLLKLLKASNFLNASITSKMELARRVGLQLEEANVSDLLIPSLNDTLYDVDIVMIMLEQFMSQSQSPPTSPLRSKMGLDRRTRSRSAENIDYEFQESRRSSSASHSSKLKVAKLVDGYLNEIARDSNLSMSKFIAIAETVPGFARLNHDDLYKAIDIYLKAHPDLNKSERKRLCRVLDCKKLSVEACMHAAENELLPLRVVVKVLFFEQARAGLNGGKVTEIPSNLKALLAAQKNDLIQTGELCSKSTVQTEGEWSISELRSPELRLGTLRMKIAEDGELEENEGMNDSTKVGSLCALRSKPKRMFSKFWSFNRRANEKK